MDTKNHIQLIKSQIMNMKLQIDNIDMQNNNMFMMNNNQIGEQLINLSIQILNTGIQAFNIGKKLIINYNKYIEQLKLISQNINLFINENNMIQQQQMMIPKNKVICNMVFKHNFINNYGDKVVILAGENNTIEELLNLYRNKVINYFNEEQLNNMKFFCEYNNIYYLKRNDKRTLRDVFKNLLPNPSPILVEYSL